MRVYSYSTFHYLIISNSNKIALVFTVILLLIYLNSCVYMLYLLNNGSAIKKYDGSFQAFPFVARAMILLMF